MSLLKTKAALICIVLIFSMQAGAVQAQNSTDNPNPLQPFEKLVGGKWYLGNSYHTFEWGVGEKSVKAKSYTTTEEGGQKLVAEFTWLWHPGEEQIKAYGTSTGMGIDYWEMTTRFEENKMINELHTYGPRASEHPQKETWEFTDQDHYIWTLYEKKDGEFTQIMNGTFERKRASSK